MRKIKRLSLRKEDVISFEDAGNIKGGDFNEGPIECWTFKGNCTAGCSDGICKTLWNCTEASCTNDCSTGICDTELFCTM